MWSRQHSVSDEVDADMGDDRVDHNDDLCRALPVTCRKHRDSMVGTVTGGRRSV